MGTLGGEMLFKLKSRSVGMTIIYADHADSQITAAVPLSSNLVFNFDDSQSTLHTQLHLKRQIRNSDLNRC